MSYPCGQKHRHVPCTILVDAHLELNKKYHLKGTTLNHTSRIIFKSNGCYKEIQPSRIALLHHKLRETCHRRILNLFSSRESGSFASSLLLGTPLPKHLKDIFKKKGLAHIFAISGWHFSLCASLLFSFSISFQQKYYLYYTSGIHPIVSRDSFSMACLDFLIFTLSLSFFFWCMLKLQSFRHRLYSLHMRLLPAYSCIRVKLLSYCGYFTFLFSPFPFLLYTVEANSTKILTSFPSLYLGSLIPRTLLTNLSLVPYCKLFRVPTFRWSYL